jgi:hypothetical protein
MRDQTSQLKFSMATKASLVRCSLKLRHIDLGQYRDGDRQVRPGAVNLGPSIGVDFML